MITKARELAVDEIFLDLEDSVAISDKTSARTKVISELQTGGFKAQSVAVRINEPNSEIGKEDVAALISEATGRFDSMIVPKVETAIQINELAATLSKLEQSKGLELGTTKLQLQIESALGLSNIKEIATASNRIISLIFGPGDFAASMGMQVLHIGDNPIGYPGEDAYQFVLMTILLAARTNGLLAIDGPFGDIQNSSGLQTRSELAASLGFDGKWVIHPSQIEIVNRAFTPSQEYFNIAARIIEHFAQAAKSSDPKGAFLFEGKMIDEATRKMAEVIYLRGIAAGLTLSN